MEDEPRQTGGVFLLGELPSSQVNLCTDPTNCFGYILGEKGKVDAETFLELLTQRGYIDTIKPADEDIVLYGKDDRLLHAGIFREGMVDSKFGDDPMVLRHTLSHSVIQQYGEVIRILTRRSS